MTDLLNKTRFSLVLMASIFISIPSYAQRMAISVDFSVGVDGAAKYSLPLTLRGNAEGVMPSIAIEYNSQGKNGILGKGWSLSGFSAISRCAKTYAQDGINMPALDNYETYSTAAFCVDGRRLFASGKIPVVAADTMLEYKSEMADFSLIRGSFPATRTMASDGKHFTMYTKSGLIMTYMAKTMVPSIQADTYSNELFWPLLSITDRFKNQVGFEYIYETGDMYYYPGSVSYRSPRSTSRQTLVSFEYEFRPDVVNYNREGTWHNMGKRLKKITTSAGDSDAGISTLREYYIAYDQDPATGESRVTSITECDQDKKSCLPPTTFSYGTTGNIAFGTTVQSSVLDWGQSAGRGMVDLNGDGRADFCRVIGNDGANQLACTLSTGNGFGSTMLSDTVDPGIDVSRKWIDVNGDGFADFCRVTGIAGAYQMSCTLGGEAGFVSTVSSPIDPGNEMGNAVWADVQSKGNMQYCRFDSASTFKCAALQAGTFVDTTYPGTGSGKFDLVDIIGGGLFFRCVPNTNPHQCNSVFPNMSSVLKSFSFNAAPPNGLWADVNGDGRKDYCAFSSGKITCWPSFGNSDISYPRPIYAPFQSLPVAAGLSVGERWVDVNQDGRDDYCRIVGSTGAYKLLCSLSNGPHPTTSQSQQTENFGVTVTSEVIDPGINIGGVEQGWADVNGSGAPAFCRLLGTTNLADSRIACTPILVSPPGVTQISNGVGQSTTVSYKRLTDSTVYTKDRDAVLPQIDVVKPFYVVSSVSSNDGAGGTRNATYSYGGLKADPLRRALLGFRWVQSTQQESGISTRTEYRQDWPFVGMPNVASTSAASGGNNGLLSKTTISYGCNDFVSADGCTIAPGARYFPYLKQSVKSTWDLTGSVMPELSVTQQFDEWGNPVQVTSASSDGYSTVTTNTYLNSAVTYTNVNNSTPSWIIGRLLKTVVTRTSP